MDRHADEARFRPVAPFYLSSPNRTRESIARVFRGGHLPSRLVAFVHNEVDALLVLLGIELRLWSRAAWSGDPPLIDRFEIAFSELSRSAALGPPFFAGLRFLCSPHQGTDREQALTINFRRDRLSIQARTRLLGLADLIEVAERLALFTDEPRLEEQPEEAGELRRALRQNVQLSTGNSDRCIVRLPKLSFRYFREATNSLLTDSFLPTEVIRSGKSPAAESRWIQILIDAVSTDENEAARPLSLVDRVKRLASEKWQEFAELVSYLGKPAVKLTGQADVTDFFSSSKTALILLGAGGAGKSTLVSQIAAESHYGQRTTLVIALRQLREAGGIGQILCATLGVAEMTDVELLSSIAMAFADRGEELVIVFDGLNEFGDAKKTDTFCRSLFDAATLLSQTSHDMPSIGPAVRLILTSRQEAYFGARARLQMEPPAGVFHMTRAGFGHLPKPYLEIAPLTPEEREKLFSLYFDDMSESGAEHQISRIARGNPQFAALLSRPIMIVLASELYKRGMRIDALQSSSDFADLIVEQGFESLASAEKRENAWIALDSIFEQRLRLGDRDIVKADDVWSAHPSQKAIVLEALSNLADMNILRPVRIASRGEVHFFHDRIEEALLGRYLSRLNSNWQDRALETCVVLSEGRTLYQEALVYHLRDALAAYLTGESNRPELFAHRWNVLCSAAARTVRPELLSRILARSFFDLYSGSRAGLLHENWLALGLRAAGGRSDFTDPSRQRSHGNCSVASRACCAIILVI